MQNKKNVISIAVLVLILLAGIGYKLTQSNPQLLDNLKQPTDKSTVESALNNTLSSSGTSAADSRTITKQPPVNGTKYGVIEVGASGFNSFAVVIDKDDNWELLSKEFGESLAYEGFITTDDVRIGLKKYMAGIFEKGVAGRNVHFVISSGALKNPKTEIIAQAISKMGYFVNRVNATDEGRYALAALLDKDSRKDSFTVDIGSGNTKISWYENGRITSIECSGAKYYQDKGKTDESVKSEIAKAVSIVPAHLRKNCFIIGGVPFKLAKESRQGEERFTFLNSPDNYSVGDDVKKKSGLVIYEAIYRESGCNNFIFDWDANFTIGFLLGLN